MRESVSLTGRGVALLAARRVFATSRTVSGMGDSCQHFVLPPLVSLLDVVDSSDDDRHHQQDEVGLTVVVEVLSGLVAVGLPFRMGPGVCLFEGGNRLSLTVQAVAFVYVCEDVGVRWVRHRNGIVRL